MHLQQTFGECLGQLRIKNPGGDRVYLYAKGACLARETLCKANHRSFRSRIVDGSGQRPHRANGSDIEDASLPLPNHLLVDGLRYCEETSDIRVDYLVPGAVS